MKFSTKHKVKINFNRIIPIVFMAALLSLIYSFRYSSNEKNSSINLSPLSLFSSNSVQHEGYPRIGFWMIAPNGQPADWLGEKYGSKQLIEPINIIIMDSAAGSAEEAKIRLMTAMTEAGYPSRTGHSSGYSGFIAEKLYPMLPAQKHHSFSDKHPEFDNNHGRIFGPHRENNVYYFTGAFSRENIAPLDKVMHAFASFNQARNDVAQKLDKKTAYKIQGKLKLGNSFTNNLLYTTGDHDGTAIVISARN